MERVFKRDGILFKILPCLLITMYAFMVLYGSFVYATNIDCGDYTVISNEEMDTSHEYFVICVGTIYNQGPNIFFLYSDSPIKQNDYYFYSGEYSATQPIFYKWLSVNSAQNGVIDFSTASFSSSNGMNLPDDYQILSSNHDIYDYYDNLVFQAPPQEQIQATSLVIAPQVEGVQMNKVLQEILGILPVILLVIVGLLAIRKGIQMIMAFLRKS